MLLYLVCAKWSELITEVNRISVQQLPFCLPLCHVVLSSEVLNSSIKNCFEGVVFQDAVCEECFSISLWCLYLQCVCDCFDESFIIKIILVSGFYFLFVSTSGSNSLDLTLVSTVIHVQCPYLKLWADYQRIQHFFA